MARIEWRVQRGVRCDIVAYAALNLAGKRTAVQIFPDSRKGELETEDLGSLVIRAPLGTRVVLMTSGGASWEEQPWRCVRLLATATMPAARQSGLPGVRIPDLEHVDPPDAQRVDPDFRMSYRLVERLADGRDWSFGRAGPLKGKVKVIRVEREQSDEYSAAEAVARAVLSTIAERHRDALGDALGAAEAAVRTELTREGVADAAERAERLVAWARSL